MKSTDHDNIENVGFPFKERSEMLNKCLSTSAFRRGTSAFRLGLIPQGISDHLPIEANIKTNHGQHKLLSWNMLADTHLFNNFRNISGSDYWRELLLKQFPEGCIYVNEHSNQLFHFFAEIGQYLYSTRDNNSDREYAKIIINSTILRNFITTQTSRLARSRDANTAEKKKTASA